MPPETEKVRDHDNVRVSLMQDRKTGKFFFRVYVAGLTRMKSGAHIDIPAGSSKMLHRVMVAAGACAEYLCKMVKERFLDPDACAHAAGLAFKELVREHPIISTL